MTMVLVSSITVGAGGASNITFSSVPQNATDLMLLVSTRADVNWYDYVLTFNGNSTNYTRRMLGSDGGNKVYSSGTTNTFLGANNPSDFTASTFSSNTIYIPNYSGANNKTFSIDAVTENNSAAADIRLNGGNWNNTAAITSVAISLQTNLFVQNTTASLYTITKGSGGATAA